MLREEQETLTLIQQVLNKNKLAEERFFKKYKKVVEDYIKYKLPKVNDDDFNDCVSNILIKIYYSLDKYNPEKSSFNSWIIAITKHYMIDAWRVNSTSVSALNSVSFTTIVDGTLPAFTVTACNSDNFITANNTGNLAYTTNGTITCNNEFENCSSINYISQQISPEEFTLLDMKYVQGYNYIEIGKEFNVTSSTISNRVNYIKTKLKKNIQEIIYD